MAVESGALLLALVGDVAAGIRVRCSNLLATLDVTDRTVGRYDVICHIRARQRGEVVDVSPKPNERDINEWVSLYESGESYEQISREVGFSTMTIWKALRGRVAGRTTGEGNHLAFLRRHADLIPLVIEAYNGGASVLAMSKSFGVTRATIARILQSHDLPIRSGSDANRIRFGGINAPVLPQYQRKPVDPDLLIFDPSPRALITRAMHLSMGKGEPELEKMLLERGYQFTRQLPVGDYNIDLAYRDLAVEVHRPGGNPLAPRSRELKRCEALMRRGWHVLFVWTRGGIPESGSADQVIALLEETGRNPTATRQYWVIRSDGEIATSGRDKPQEISFKHAPRRRERLS